MSKVRCPDCQGFGYFEDGIEEGVLCEVCDGDGVIEESPAPNEATAYVRELRDQLAIVNADLKRIVEHPELIEGWTPAQLAWTKEQLEHLHQESRKLRDKILAHIDKEK